VPLQVSASAELQRGTTTAMVQMVTQVLDLFDTLSEYATQAPSPDEPPPPPQTPQSWSSSRWPVRCSSSTSRTRNPETSRTSCMSCSLTRSLARSTWRCSYIVNGMIKITGWIDVMEQVIKAEHLTASEHAQGDSISDFVTGFARLEWAPVARGASWQWHPPAAA
jgi:hypothetical protein